MSDYKELVKALRCCAENFGCPIECPRYSPDDEGVRACVSRLEKDAAAAIEALQAEVEEIKRVNMELFDDLPKYGDKILHWVSVEDEKPKEEKLYMTVHRNSKTVRLNWWRNPWGFCYEGSTVEYWMPLPEPPQEVQDDK